MANSNDVWIDCETVPDNLKWITPPKNQGQFVVVSYSDIAYNGEYYRQIADGSSRTICISRADAKSFNDWDPINKEPVKNRIQSMLQVAFDELGYNCREYSGRGMYGKNCLGVDLEESNLFTIGFEVAEWVGNNYPERLCEVKDSINKIRQDSLGMNVIVYFPNVEFGTVYPDID